MLGKFSLGTEMLHFFTDDPQYRKHTKEIYAEAVQHGILAFGPTVYDPKLEPGTSASDRAKFKRCTSSKDALIEFTCMALADEFIGTAGSTVTALVQALNGRYCKPFDAMQVIGNYDVPSRPTMNFRKQVSECTQNLGDRIRNQIDVTITHEQSNVLDFLHESHLEEMYWVLHKHLQNGPMLGSKLGEAFLKECRVARLNKAKFLEQVHNKPHNQHWFKALIKGRLRQFSTRRPECDSHVEIDENAMICLRRKISGNPTSSSSSSSWGLDGPQMKRSRVS